MGRSKYGNVGRCWAWNNWGAEGDGPDRFLCGVFLSISAARNAVPLLQTVYQADATHMNFGKYMLYSCYGVTANCNAFPVAFGIILAMRTRKDGINFGGLLLVDIHVSTMPG
jgi:hypothetical protein